MRILVVEDSPTQAAEVAFILEDGGFEVDLAADGVEGLARVEQQAFDLVLSDVLMPNMTGYELCQKIKERSSDIPVFLCTTLNRDVDILRGLESGADGYINKPYDPDDLVRRLESFLATRAARRAAASNGHIEARVGEQCFRLPREPEQLVDYFVSVLAHFHRDRERTAGNDERAAQALRRSEERFALAVSGANDGLWDWDLDTGSAYFSARWKNLLGYEDTEIGHTFDEWRTRVHADDRERFMMEVEAHLAGALPHLENEHRVLNKAGEYQWVLARGRCVRDGAGRASRVAGSLTDVSSRKSLEERLLAVGAELNAIFQALPDLQLLLDAKGTVLDCHGGAASVRTIEPSQTIGLPIAEVLPGETGDQVLRALEQARDSGVPKELEHVASTPNGDRSFELRVTHVQADQFLVMMRDITERTRAEETRRLMHFSVDSAPDAIFWVTRDGRLQYVNDAACRSLGYDRDELLALRPSDLDVALASMSWETVWDYLKENRTVLAQTRHRRKDGSTLTVDVRVSLLDFGGREYVCAYARNVGTDSHLSLISDSNGRSAAAGDAVAPPDPPAS